MVIQKMLLKNCNINTALAKYLNSFLFANSKMGQLQRQVKVILDITFMSLQFVSFSSLLHPVPLYFSAYSFNLNIFPLTLFG